MQSSILATAALLAIAATAAAQPIVDAERFFAGILRAGDKDTSDDLVGGGVCFDVVRPDTVIAATIRPALQGDRVLVTILFVKPQSVLLDDARPEAVLTGDAPDSCMPHVTVEALAANPAVAYVVAEVCAGVSWPCGP